MKSLRVIGSVFIVFGFFFALIGILTSLVPMIENEQFKLIINSFQETSADAITNTLNAIIRFCLHSSYFLLFCGISLMVIGGLISSTARRKQNDEAQIGNVSSATMPAALSTGIPQPAYYPGGMAPPIPGFPGEMKSAPNYTLENDSLDFRNTAVQKAVPITGSMAAAFSADESDAQKLMLQDRQRASRATEELPLAGDTFRYPSNTVADQERIALNKAAEFASEAAKTPAAATSQRPRIVSTIGKKIRQ